MLVSTPTILLDSARTRAAGLLLFGMIILSIIWGFFPDSNVTVYRLSGVLAVGAGLLLVVDVSGAQRLQVGVLLLIGMSLLWFSSYRGIAVDFTDVISRNTGLLSMITAVGFLRLVVIQDSEQTVELPIGKKAYLNTLIGVGIFGSVINISAPIVICDRLSEKAPIDLFTAKSMTRIFSACAAWSPYFAGAAVVLTYVEGVNLVRIMSIGFPLLLTAIAVVYLEARYRNGERVEQFRGYPISFSSLWIPVVLTIMVILLQQLIEGLSVLVSITLASVTLTILVLIQRNGVIKGAERFYGYIKTGLPKTVNELLLFLAAGVLAAGLTSLVNAGVISFSLSSFSVVTASLLLAVMIVISAFGIHPVIQISSITPLLLPVNPAPDLLAITYMFAWSLGTCVCPLSGTHLIFQGRYGIPAWRGATANWGYCVFLYFVAVGLLYLHSVI